LELTLLGLWCSLLSWQYDDIVTPSEVKAEIKASKCAEKLIQESRQSIAEVISGNDDRLIVVVGPCSIHS
jgi:3-deoxy-7-phosphoheptulonate synthase